MRSQKPPSVVKLKKNSSYFILAERYASPVSNYCCLWNVREVYIVNITIIYGFITFTFNKISHDLIQLL